MIKALIKIQVEISLEKGDVNQIAIRRHKMFFIFNDGESGIDINAVMATSEEKSRDGEPMLYLWLSTGGYVPLFGDDIQRFLDYIKQ